MPSPIAVAVIELNYGGHYAFYVRKLIDGLPPSTQATLYGSTGLVNSAALGVETDGVKEKMHIVDLGGTIKIQSRRLLDVVRSDTFSGNAFVVVPSADRVLPHLLAMALAARRNKLPPLRFILMRTTKSVGLREQCTRIAKLLLIKALTAYWPDCKAYFLTDGVGYVKSREGYRALMPIADPAYDLRPPTRSDARKQLSLREDVPIVAMVGALNHRKRPDLLVSALSLMPGIEMLAAGSCSDESLGLALSRWPEVASRTLCLNYYLSDVELLAAAAAADVVIISQDTDAPSGTLLLAILAGTPIVAMASPWVCSVVEDLGIGLVAHSTEDALRTAIAAVLSRGPDFSDALAAARAQLDPQSLNTLLE